MTPRRYNSNVYSMSQLAKKAGIGTRMTWRKIIARPQFEEMFDIVSENPRGVYVETNLSRDGLQSIYKKHLGFVYEENKKTALKAVQIRLAKKKQMEEDKLQNSQT